MKKFFASVLVMGLCVAAFAVDYKFPGFDCKDKAVLEQMLAVAPNPGQKFNCLLTLSVLDKNFTTFKALSDYVDSVDITSTGMTKARAANMTINIKKLFAWYRYPALLKEAYAYSLTNPSACDFRLITNPAVGLTETEQYTALVAFLTTRKNLSAADVNRCIDNVIALAPVVQVGTQKEDLQKINRIFTPYVIKDKATWEPVLTKVRTVLATY